MPGLWGGNHETKLSQRPQSPQRCPKSTRQGAEPGQPLFLSFLWVDLCGESFLSSHKNQHRIHKIPPTPPHHRFSLLLVHCSFDSSKSNHASKLVKEKGSFSNRPPHYLNSSQKVLKRCSRGFIYPLQPGAWCRNIEILCFLSKGS